MNDEELEDEEIDNIEDDSSSSDSFFNGYYFAKNTVDDVKNFYDDYKQNKQLSDKQKVDQNLQSTSNNNIVANQNNENVNDLVMKDRLNSLKNGGNDAAKEAINKGASSASSNAGIGTQIASSAKNVYDDMRQPTVDENGNELDGIDAAKQKGIDLASSVGREAGNIAGEALSDYFTVQSGGLSQVFKPAIKAVVSKTTELAARQTTKRFYRIIAIVGFCICIFLLLLVSIMISLSNDNSEQKNQNGSFDPECDFNLTKVTVLNHQGTEIGKNISLEDYIISVAYGEIGEYIYMDGYEEYAKTAFITAKTFAFATADYNSTTKNIKLRASTLAQGYCDIYSGCMIYKVNGFYWYYSIGSSFSYPDSRIYKSKLSDENIKKAKETYKTIENYLYAPKDLKEPLKSGNQLALSNAQVSSTTGYRDHTQNFWKKEAEAGKTFQQILSDTGTNLYPEFVNQTQPSGYNNAIGLSNTYSRLSLYNLASYCTYTPANGTCTTTSPIKIPDNENFRITSPFESRVNPISGKTEFHNSVDLGYPQGTPIYAVADGKVIKIDKDAKSGYGVYVRIGHDLDGDGNDDYFTQYNHMKYGTNSSLSIDMQISGGQQIGEVGSTGMSTGPHLDFQIFNYSQNKYIDPQPVLDPLRKGTSFFSNGKSCSSTTNLNEMKKLHQSGSDSEIKDLSYCGYSMSGNGCLISSYAAAYYSLTGKLLNRDGVLTLWSDMVNAGGWTCSSGSGIARVGVTSDVMRQKYGLKGTKIENTNVNNLIDILKSGKKIIISTKSNPSENISGQGYGTPGGHYIMLDHVNEKNEIYVFNPASGVNEGYRTKEEITRYVINKINSGVWSVEKG